MKLAVLTKNRDGCVPTRKNFLYTALIKFTAQQSRKSITFLNAIALHSSGKLKMDLDVKVTRSPQHFNYFSRYRYYCNKIKLYSQTLRLNRNFSKTTILVYKEIIEAREIPRDILLNEKRKQREKQNDNLTYYPVILFQFRVITFFTSTSKSKFF